MVTWGDSCQGGDSSRVTEQLRGVVALHSTRRAFAALKDTGEVVTWGTATEGGGSFMVSWQLLTLWVAGGSGLWVPLRLQSVNFSFAR